MRALRAMLVRFAAIFDRGRLDRELAAELEGHLAMAIDDNLRAGMTAEEARRHAHIQLGGVAQVEESYRERRGLPALENLARDLRFGARMLLRNPGFTAVAVLTLGLGIGANTAIFSVVHEVLLRPLPFPDAERLVMLWEVTPDGGHQNTTSRFNFRTWREQSKSFEAMAAFSDQRSSLSGGGEPEEVSVQLATPELFRILGIAPILGRVLMSEDARPDAPRVAVLGYAFWQRRFGGDPRVIGKVITLNGSPRTVVGVLPAGFQWHISKKSGTVKPAEIWVTLTMPTEGPGVHGRFLSVVARLKRGVSYEQATAEMKAHAARLAQDVPEHSKGYSAEVIPLREQIVGNVRRALLILLGAVGFVLLIACANVANLLLSRAAAREKEIALRTALGARRMRVVRQLLTESVLLAALGSLLGLGLAWWGIRALVAISPRDLVNLQGVGLQLPVLAWTLAVSLATGILFGLVPALEATRLNLNDTLKEGTKSSGGQSARSRRLRSILVVAEVALSLVLLTSAGLLMKSFDRLQKIDTGFNTENVLTMVVRLPDAKYREDPQIVGFFREALERIRTLPGVRFAGMVNYLPLYGGLGAATGFTVEGRPVPPGEEPSTDVRVADPGYFRAMEIPLLRGRNFTDLEAREARHVVLVSESMARQHFPGENPIGKRISVAMFDQPVLTEIIGIVGDVRYDSLIDKVEPTVYFPLPELAYAFMTLVIRTTGDPAEIAPAVRRELREIDPDQPVSDVRTMNQVMADTVGRARFNTLLLGLFAGLATLLAAIGVFGVINYSVTLRTREIGLRMALGAQPGKVLMLVLKQGLLLAWMGIGIGLAGALALTRLLSSLLYEVSATDPLTFAVIALLLTGVSWLACYLPARRAARLEPLIALRYDG
ncbi:MAG TPA: ABC transporter permease [Thermoanaerobaculia bacterium]|jgi:putative ABC transport system permease protein|nr:ABC transporter permease [Thermoanaerobaculia bacterium]